MVQQKLMAQALVQEAEKSISAAKACARQLAGLQLRTAESLSQEIEEKTTSIQKTVMEIELMQLGKDVSPATIKQQIALLVAALQNLGSMVSTGMSLVRGSKPAKLAKK